MGVVVIPCNSRGACERKSVQLYHPFSKGPGQHIISDLKIKSVRTRMDETKRVGQPPTRSQRLVGWWCGGCNRPNKTKSSSEKGEKRKEKMKQKSLGTISRFINIHIHHFKITFRCPQSIAGVPVAGYLTIAHHKYVFSTALGG